MKRHLSVVSGRAYAPRLRLGSATVSARSAKNAAPSSSSSEQLASSPRFESRRRRFRPHAAPARSATIDRSSDRSSGVSRRARVEETTRAFAVRFGGLSREVKKSRVETRSRASRFDKARARVGAHRVGGTNRRSSPRGSSPFSSSRSPFVSGSVPFTFAKKDDSARTCLNSGR